MKILQINSCNFGSTGSILAGLSKLAKEKHDDFVVFLPDQRDNYAKKTDEHVFIGNRVSRNLHLLLAKITGYNGCFSYVATKRFIRQIEAYQPDIIHIHSLHNGYVNLPLLFRYIKKRDIPVVWTFHDCWAFTGHCPYFDRIGCDKWKTGCRRCPQYREYPESYVDDAKKLYQLKKKWFTGVRHMTIVTPSVWLSDLVKQSFLGEYPVRVIHNGIDLSVFRPAESDFRQKYHCEHKYVILGVALGWGTRKGLDVFSELANRLNPDTYQIVLVGTNDRIDAQLPAGIISIHRTHNQAELAEIYAAADLFVNPTREENYPTVNMEALACGTPVLTFRTGGSPEIVDDTCGAVVDRDDVDALEREISDICENHRFTRSACVRHAEQFDMNERFREYRELYRSMSSEG